MSVASFALAILCYIVCRELLEYDRDKPVEFVLHFLQSLGAVSLDVLGVVSDGEVFGTLNPDTAKAERFVSRNDQTSAVQTTTADAGAGADAALEAATPLDHTMSDWPL